MQSFGDKLPAGRKISRTAEYGIIAVVYVAQNCEEGRVMAKVISKAYELPLEYLLQVMQKLVRAGVLTSKKGPNGGFDLAKPAKEITLLEIVEAIEGPVVIPMTFAQETGKPFGKKVEKVFTDVGKAAKASLEKVTLAEMAK